MTSGRVGALSLLVVLIVSGAGAAAGASSGVSSDVSITVAIEPIGSAVMPITQQVETPVRITLSCDSPADAGERPLLLDVTGPDWAVVTLDPPEGRVALNVTDCLQGSDRLFTTTLSLSLNATAPAFGPIPVNVTATYGEAAGRAMLNATVAYYERMEARLVKTVFKTAQGSSVDIPLMVDNQGNGAIVITATLGEESSQHLDVSLPEPFVVPAQTVTTVPVPVSTPAEFGYENRKDQLMLILSAAPQGDPDHAPTQKHLSAIIQTQGLSTGGTTGSIGTAALGTVIFAALVLGAVMLYRSRSSS